MIPLPRFVSPKVLGHRARGIGVGSHLRLYRRKYGGRPSGLIRRLQPPDLAFETFMKARNAASRERRRGRGEAG